MTNDTAEALVWFDCETTGLDPCEDQILEFCCFLTGPNLSVLARPYHGLVLGPRSWAAFESTLRMSPWVWKTHSGNGLLDDLQHAHEEREQWLSKQDPDGVGVDALRFAEMRTAIAQAIFHPSDDPFTLWGRIDEHTAALCMYIQDVVREHDPIRAHHALGIEGAPLLKPPLAGSTIRFDRGFLEHHAPAVLDELHYRSVDVSSMREIVRRLWPSLELPPKNESHRATSDIFASLDTLRHVRKGLIVPLRDFLGDAPKIP